ncbi:MAG TPA: gamma-glutamyl-gamma-aminobutyrate hydrolase family protein [Oscillospiraceae bacterium]|nr:gamma-glutamyl-gamma-aminobutyrate hydrolase family protein [Oscillospiraceae bacterium]HPV99733.1 gamma-glutamyl-gamma-aminobutyrate hydrolase family protein [Oscillospiraceae bacterium]
MKKPLIGITTLVDEERESYWMLPLYTEAVAKSGGVPVILPPLAGADEAAPAVRALDGLLFTGGEDIDPSYYGEEPRPEIGNISAKRDVSEFLLMKEAVAAGKPVFCICRGFQLLNVFFGGTLYQDLPSQYDSVIRHRQEKPYDEPAHAVSVAEGSPLSRIAGAEGFGVNSRHHQAVKDLGRGLFAMAISEDGLVESAFAPGRPFVMGVQWHPEHMFARDEVSRKLFSAFIEACGE